MVILHFFLGHAQVEPHGRIFTVYGSYDMFSPKDGPAGACGKIVIHLGVISPKGGVNRQFEAKRAE